MGLINKKEKNQFYDYAMKSVEDKHKNQVPIKKGCQNSQCFCTGACNEIIGWREKTLLEKGVDIISDDINKKRKQWSPDLAKQISEIDFDKKKSRFEDIEDVKKCTHVEHEPPKHLHIPQGKRYIHVCPGCEKETVVQPPQISY